MRADNGKALPVAMLESQLEELGVLKSAYGPRVSNDNHYYASMVRTVKTWLTGLKNHAAP